MPLFDEPQPFGRYTLLNRIAVGGMAEVFKAKISGLGGFEKILAIKRLHPNFTEDHQFIRMLIDEAKITAQLTHCNIAQIYDLGMEENQYFIAMEHILGKDLFSVLRKLYTNNIKIPIEAGVYMGMEICNGLYYAHNKRDANGRPLSIIHRDISPQNILISYDGEVKIIDFGIAKAAERFTATETGVIKGKFYYMSPEQAKGGKLDHRSDIFSTGLILYEILTSSLVYTDEDDVTLLARVQEAQIKRPLEVRQEITPMLDKIVMKALAGDPDDRYQSALEMHHSLANFLLTLPSNFGRHELGEWVRGMFKDDYHKEFKVKPGQPADPKSKDLVDFFLKRRTDKSDGAMIPISFDPSKPPIPAPAHSESSKAPQAPPMRMKIEVVGPEDLDTSAATRIEQIDLQRSEAATVMHQLADAPKPKKKTPVNKPKPMKSDELVGLTPPKRKRKHQQLLMWTLVGLSWIIIAFGVLIVVSVRQKSPDPPDPKTTTRTKVVKQKPPLKPLSKPAKLLVVHTYPTGAAVTLNGTQQATPTPLFLRDLRSKVPHRIKLSKAGYADLHITVTLNPGQTLVETHKLIPRVKPSRGESKTPPPPGKQGQLAPTPPTISGR